MTATIHHICHIWLNTSATMQWSVMPQPIQGGALPEDVAPYLSQFFVLSTNIRSLHSPLIHRTWPYISGRVGNVSAVSYQLSHLNDMWLPTCQKFGKISGISGQHIIKFCYLDHARQHEMLLSANILAVTFGNKEKTDKFLRTLHCIGILQYVQVMKTVSHKSHNTHNTHKIHIRYKTHI